jgi:hypothetical protein
VFRPIAILTLLSLAAIAHSQNGAAPGPGSPQPLVSEESASLQIKGKVRVNQQLIEGPTSVIGEGDRVETGPFAAARISAPGMSVYLPANSCVTYGGQQLEVCNCGSVQVSARKPVSLVFRDRDLVVSSQGQNAAFTMSVAGSDLEVVNQEGTTNIVKSGTVLTRLSSPASHSLAGLGCRMTANNYSSAAGAAAAIATPAAIAGVAIMRATNRQPVSSIAP